MSSFTAEARVLTPELSKLTESVRKIDCKLECPICLESYKEPKLLPCFHVFCKSPCLENLVQQGPEGPTLSCPTCRKLVTLPDNGVAGLQTDFHIEHLFEIRESLEQIHKANKCQNCLAESTSVKYCQQCTKLMCESCIDIHGRWGDFRHHKIIDARLKTVPSSSSMPSLATPVPTCLKHSTVEAKIFCETCGVLACSDCTLSVHKDHKFSLTDNVLPKYTEELSSNLTPLQEKLDEVKQALEAFDTRAQEIRNRKTSVESNITLKVGRLHQYLDQRKEQLIRSLESENDQKLKELATQRDSVELTSTKLSSCLEYAEECLREGKVLASKDSILERIEQIMAEFDSESIQPATESDLELVDTAAVEEACQEFGQIIADPVSAKCSHASGNGTVYAIANYQASVEVHAATIKNKKVEGTVDISAELVHIKTKAFIKCTLSHESGQYVVTYKPIIRGKHKLHIRVEKEDIHGSPFPIAVTPSLESLRRPRVIHGLCMPCGATTNSKKQILTIEYEHRRHRVTVLTPGGERLLSIGTRGAKNGQLDFPSGLAVDLDDNIYVADKENHRVQKFTSEGKFVAAAGSHGNQDLQFMSPSGLAFDKVMQTLYVCDQLNNRVQVLTTDLEFVRCFGTEGSDQGQFKSPVNATFDESNSLYVTDSGNNRVQVFTAEGQFLRAFSDKANGEMMQQPFAVAIDSSNIVYVSEGGRNIIGLYTQEGRYIMSFGSRGSKEGQFNKIRGLHIEKDDSILVSDHKKNRLLIF